MKRLAATGLQSHTCYFETIPPFFEDKGVGWAWDDGSIPASRASLFPLLKSSMSRSLSPTWTTSRIASEVSLLKVILTHRIKQHGFIRHDKNIFVSWRHLSLFGCVFLCNVQKFLLLNVLLSSSLCWDHDEDGIWSGLSKDSGKQTPTAGGGQLLSMRATLIMHLYYLSSHFKMKIFLGLLKAKQFFFANVSNLSRGKLESNLPLCVSCLR